MIHWQPAMRLTIGGPNQNVLNRTIVPDSKKSALYALVVVDPDKDEENNNAHFQLAISTNQGKTWTNKAEKVEFPIPIKNECNPTVCWDEIHAKWIMTIVDEQTVKFFSSADLLKWKFESSLEKELQYTANIWQKATIFPINNGANWVMLVDQEFVNPRDGSSIQYFIGTFDGQKFNAPISTKSKWLDYGKDNIYNVVCTGLNPTADPLVIGWKNNIDYTMIGSMRPFWGSFTTPRTLSVDQYSGEKVLVSQPIKVDAGSKPILLKNLNVEEKLDISSKITVPITPSIITLKFKTNEKTRMNFPSQYGILFENDKAEKLIIGYDAFKEWYFVDRTNFTNVKDNSQFKGMDIMPSYNSDSIMVIKLILDDSSVELFAENGKQVMTENFIPQSKFNKISLFAENGIIKLEELQITKLKSIWDRK
jgi:fructan beta-fructosidase